MSDEVLSWALFFGVLIGAFLLGAAFSLLMSRWVPLGEARDEGVSGVKLQGIYTIYAVILGFVVFTGWQFYTAASGSVRQEAAAVMDLASDARALPADQGGPVLLALGRYLTETVGPTWPQGRDVGDPNDPARRALQDLTNSVAAINGDGSVLNIQSELLTSISDVNKARSDRVFYANDTGPAFVWTLMAVGGLLVIVLSALMPTRQPRMQALLVGAMSATIALCLFTAYALNSPYGNPFPVGSDPLQASLRFVEGK